MEKLINYLYPDRVELEINGEKTKILLEPQTFPEYWITGLKLENCMEAILTECEDSVFIDQLVEDGKYVVSVELEIKEKTLSFVYLRVKGNNTYKMHLRDIPEAFIIYSEIAVQYLKNNNKYRLYFLTTEIEEKTI